jgi:uracil phosphoribosyltransferase
MNQDDLQLIRVLKRVKASELRPSRRRSKLAAEIVALSKTMAENDALLLDPKFVTYSTWASAVERLKEDGLLAETFHIERNGKEFYFTNRPKPLDKQAKN